MLKDSWKVIEQFEQRMAEYCGAPYAVSVDTCTAAIFLCFKMLEAKKVLIPSKTYLGVACAVIHSGAKLELNDNYEWKGHYWMMANSGDVPIIDSACRLYTGMYFPKTLTCLSFQSRKHLKIGRGGMILTDNSGFASWLRKARFCGRGEVNGIPEFVGWHAYLEPERAARGLVMMDSLPDINEDLVFEYPDLREYGVLK